MKIDIEELKRLAEDATPGPWVAAISTNMDNKVCHSFGGICQTGKDIGDAIFIAAANPAAILELIAEIDSLRDQVNGLTGELGRERKRLDWAVSRESFYDHTTRVFFCDRAFKIPNPQVRIETDNFRATIDELMG